MAPQLAGLVSSRTTVPHGHDEDLHREADEVQDLSLPDQLPRRDSLELRLRVPRQGQDRLRMATQRGRGGQTGWKKIDYTETIQRITIYPMMEAIVDQIV